MATYFDRYKNFRYNGGMKPVIGVTIPDESTDKFAIYKIGLSRLDKMSFTYYNNPYSGWLIMLANPEYGGLEFNIPDMVTLRVPYPYESAIQRYNNQIKNHIQLYGE